MPVALKISESSELPDSCPLEIVSESKGKKYAKNAGKGLGALASVALTAYLSMQQAISERPTKEDLNTSLIPIKEMHEDTKARVKKLEESFYALKEVLVSVSARVGALDDKVTEGLEDIKEELRYLRRNR